MECELRKAQYVGKAEAAFNIRLNNHGKDVNNPKSIPSENLNTCSICIPNLHQSNN